MQGSEPEAGAGGPVSGGGQAMPPDPFSGMHEGAVALAELYRSLRRAGLSVLGAAAYMAAMARYNGEDPQQP